MTIRLCRVCGDWHSLEEAWPEGCYAHYRPKGAASGQIIRDIDPYKTVAADRDGKPAIITSRREHREFLRRNGYQEVGNDLNNAVPKPPPIDTASGRDIKHAIEQLRSRR